MGFWETQAWPYEKLGIVQMRRHTPVQSPFSLVITAQTSKLQQGGYLREAWRDEGIGWGLRTPLGANT